MPDNIKWNGAAFQAKIRREFEKRIDAAAITVQNRAKVLVSVEGTATSITGISFVRGKATGERLNVRTKLRYNANPSAPGEPPHVQTGRLRGSISHERVGFEARVGTNVKYGRWLELGTKRGLAARPWLRRALYEMTPAVNAIMRMPIL